MVKLLPFILAAVFVVVAMAVANSTPTTVTGAAAGRLHSAELMHLYERNRRFDVTGLWCLTPLGEFDVRCMLAHHPIAQSGD